MPSPAISVVVTTHDRRELCRRAIASALAQDPPPLEVVVADDASTDGTRPMLEAWARDEPRLRVLDPAPPAGRPAPGRNRAVAAAAGDWVAFLDDDDEWLPGKLAAQIERIEPGVAVVGTNAVDDAGRPYFPGAPAVARPSRADVIRGNPLILSSVLARRDVVVAAGGFPQEPWLAGIEDYALWLEAADAGAPIVVLGAPWVRYTAHGDDRLSRRAAANEVAVARLFWRRWWRDRSDLGLRRAALSRTSYALTIARQALVGR
jgi:glycosyltransferase involved in cell wall biosynthesis